MSTVADVRKAIEDDGEKLTGDIYSDFRKQTDATIDQWLANNYESLKDYKYLGSVARNAMVSLNETNNKEGEGKPQSLLAKYGLSPDYRAPNHWGKLSKTQLERIARNAGYKDYEAFKQALWDESKAFEREKVWTDFKQEHPVINVIAEAFFPNTYEGTKRIVESGEGEESDLYDDFAEDFVLGTASSLNPVGKVGKVGTLGKVIEQGVWSGAFSALNEFSQAYNYDKDINLGAIMLGTGLGSGSEFLATKRVGDALKHLFPENPTVKKFSRTVENAVGDAAAEAVDYKNGMQKKLNLFNDPVNNPASKEYKRSYENALNEAVTEEQAKQAKEALQLFNYVQGGKKPSHGTEIFVKHIDPKTGKITFGNRELTYSDDEIAKAFANHPALNNFDVAKNGGSAIGKKIVKNVGVPVYSTAKTGVVGGINAKTTREEDTKSTERKAKEKSVNPVLIAKWLDGDIPSSGADKNYPAFMVWGRNNPKEMAKALIAAKKRKAAEEAFAVEDYRFAGMSTEPGSR